MYKKVAENRFGQVKYVITIDSDKTLEQEVQLLPKFGHETGCIAECFDKGVMNYYYHISNVNGGDGIWVKAEQINSSIGGINSITDTFINSLTF